MPHRRARGTSGRTFVARLLYCSSRMPRRISSASRTPSVVSRAHLAPREVSVALVVTVVPCTMVSMAAARSRSASGGSIAAAMSARPLTTAIEGSAGVESVLKMRGGAPSRATTKSVNVPPTSMPILSVMAWLRRWSAA